MDELERQALATLRKSPVKDERPQVRFERGRQVGFVVGLVVLVGFCAFVGRGVLFPMSGMDRIAGAAAPLVTAAPVAVAVSPSPVGVERGRSVWSCIASEDVRVGGAVVPAGAVVLVDGYSAGRGGMLHAVAGPWFLGASVACDGIVSQVPYQETITPTPTSTSTPAPTWTPAATQTPRIVYSVREVVVTATPTEVVPTVPVPGVYREGDCWRVSVEGVAAIFVDGVGVGVGVHCPKRAIEIRVR